MRRTSLALLVALPTLAGCSVGLPSLHEDPGLDGLATSGMQPEAYEAQRTELADAGDLLADFALMPGIEEFDVHPTALPLGGGPVLVTWGAQDVHNCAVVVDDVPAMHGASGELMVHVRQDTDVRLVCLDADQELVAEARQEVTVVEPPVEAFEPDQQVHLATWEATELVGRSGVAGEVHEVEVVLADDGRLVVDVSAHPARSQFELWLAADANGDGFVAWNEVLQVERSSDIGRIDQVLPAGAYSLFVVTVTGAATWQLDASVTDPTSDGSNF